MSTDTPENVSNTVKEKQAEGYSRLQLKIGGRYTTAGAIAGPISEIDIRTRYLKDLALKLVLVPPQLAV